MSSSPPDNPNDALPPTAAAAAGNEKPQFWTRRRKISAFVCGVVSLVLLAIMVPVLLFVVMPKIAQDSINHSTLTFTQVNITDITDASYTLSSKGRVENAGSFDADISFDGPVNVYWTNRPNSNPDLLIGTMSLPGFSVAGAAPKSGNVEIPGATFKVESVDSMSLFSKYLISEGTFSWRLKGKAAAKALGITIKGLSLDKVVSLNGLKNVTITSFDLPTSDPTKGITIATTTLLQNPSPITIQLGNLTFDSYVLSSKIGVLSAADVTLTPGPNSLSLNGHLRAIDQKDVAVLGEVFSFYVGGVGTKLRVVGTEVAPPKGSCRWLEAGFVGLPMEVTLEPPVGAQQLVSGIQIPSIGVTFDPNDPTGTTLSSTAPSISATFRSPFAFPLNIQTASQDLTFIDPTTSTPFARLQVPFTPATADQTAQTLSTSFTNAKLTSLNDAAFQGFLASLTLNAAHTFNVKGVVSSQANTAGGLVTIANVSLTDTLTFRGLQGLPTVSVDGVKVTGGTVEGGITMEIDTTIENGSMLSMDLGTDVRLALGDEEGVVVGEVVLPGMRLVPGRNGVKALGVFRPEGGARERGMRLLSRFLQPGDQSV
ncbi:hypothetical protein HDU67_000616, partial [Dinochytrium kinnereticum]